MKNGVNIENNTTVNIKLNLEDIPIKFKFKYCILVFFKTKWKSWNKKPMRQKVSYWVRRDCKSPLISANSTWETMHQTPCILIFLWTDLLSIASYWTIFAPPVLNFFGEMWWIWNYFYFDNWTLRQPAVRVLHVVHRINMAWCD